MICCLENKKFKFSDNETVFLCYTSQKATSLIVGGVIYIQVLTEPISKPQPLLLSIEQYCWLYRYLQSWEEERLLFWDCSKQNDCFINKFFNRNKHPCLLANKTRLLFRDLKIDSPYNTYKNKGLPPGPICNPGAASLRAAAAPRFSKYLFYVMSPKLGRHRFAETFAQHEQNIKLAHAEQKQETK